VIWLYVKVLVPTVMAALFIKMAWSSAEIVSMDFNRAIN